MKKQMITAAVLMAGLIGSSAKAQNLIAKIPFEFTVNRATQAPGKYRIARMSTNGGIQLTNLATRRAVVAMVAAAGAGHDSANLVVFHKYGDRYFLRELRSGASVIAMPESGEERSLRMSGETPMTAQVRLQKPANAE